MLGVEPIGPVSLITAGERVDLWAHLLGFVAGASLGIATPALARHLPRNATQARLTAVAIAAVLGCWVVALR